MPISTQAQIGNEQQSTQALKSDIYSSMRVAMPGVIQSFNPGAVTCTVMIAVKGKVKSESAQLPVLVDVPVIFPRGGGCTITFPIKTGDECLLVFADRCIDFWWQNGGVQESVDPRMHDLSDAFAIVGPQSQAKKISGISTQSLQVRTDDGSSYIELMQNGNVNITTPLLTVNGDVKVNGSITSTGDQVASGISQVSHVHGGVQSGGSKTGTPQ